MEFNFYTDARQAYDYAADLTAIRLVSRGRNGGALIYVPDALIRVLLGGGFDNLDRVELAEAGWLHHETAGWRFKPSGAHRSEAFVRGIERARAARRERCA